MRNLVPHPGHMYHSISSPSTFPLAFMSAAVMARPHPGQDGYSIIMDALYVPMA